MSRGRRASANSVWQHLDSFADFEKFLTEQEVADEDYIKQSCDYGIHRWKKIQGFTSVYEDCEWCGRKREDVEKKRVTDLSLELEEEII